MMDKAPTTVTSLLNKLPKSILVTALAILLAGSWTFGKSYLGETLVENKQQTVDLHQLAVTVSRLVEATENLKQSTSALRQDVQMQRAESSTQLQLVQKLIERLERRLDRTSNQ